MERETGKALKNHPTKSFFKEKIPVSEMAQQHVIQSSYSCAFFSCFERFKTSSILLTTICSKIWYPLLVYKHTHKQNTIYIINLSSQRYLPYISDGIQCFWDSYGFTRECFGFTWLSLCFSLLALALHEYLTFYKYYSEIRWYIIALLYSIGCLYVQMDSTLPPKWVHWLLVS